MHKFGVDIGRYAQYMAQRLGRTDLHYLGHMEADVEVAPGVVIRIMHPGGGSGAAISMTSQRIVESLDGPRPFMICAGHYHKAEYLPAFRGVHVVQTGCFQAQSPFMRKKRLASDIGGWIIELNGKNDYVRVQAEFVRFDAPVWSYQ